MRDDNAVDAVLHRPASQETGACLGSVEQAPQRDGVDREGALRGSTPAPTSGGEAAAAALGVHAAQPNVAEATSPVDVLREISAPQDLGRHHKHVLML